VTSPVHVIAAAWSGQAVAGLKLTVDGVLAYKTTSDQIDTTLQVGPGPHRITGTAWNSTQGEFSKSVAIEVNPASSSSAAPTPSTGSSDPGSSAPTASQPQSGSIPSSATKFGNIEEMPGWGSCTICAGIGGNGPQAQYSMTEGVSSPSMDGKSAHFWLGGHTPFSAAIWFKQLGGNSSVHHLVYDLSYFVKDPGASQALEFDVNQSTGSAKYIFGTQCDFKGAAKNWDVWDSAHHTWVHTGVHCDVPSANSWHHLTWELERTGDNHAHFIAFTIDGARHQVDKYFSPERVSAYELNVAFQMDGDQGQQNYDVWLDEVNLYAW
jgi:hypothetical protein